jgi:hypothetical protein
MLADEYVLIILSLSAHIRLTEKRGWTFPGFEAQRQNEKTIKDRQDEIGKLT